MVRIIFCTLLCSLIFLSSSAQKTKSSAADQWVDSVYEAMSDDERVGQLFMIAAYSKGDSREKQDVINLIREHKPGGILFMQGGPVRQVQNYNRFQQESKIPLLVGMDLEWGLSMRLDSTMSFPRQMTLGAVQNDSLIQAMGREIARQMKLIGAHINFAPVADINSNPKNPVIGTRSFGDNKSLVAQKAGAYARGLQEGGVIAVAKHFPGHGDTDKDSHTALPVISHSSDRINDQEAYPFKTLIKDGIHGIMTGHLLVNSLDDTNPATLSEKITTDYLRNELNFDGLIFTDALNMKAVSETYAEGMAELMAFQAGADVLLFSMDMPAAKSRILGALESDRKLRKQLEESVKRILHAKFKVNLDHFTPLSEDNLVMRLNSPQADVLANELYEKSVTVLSNEASLVPIKQLDNRSFAYVAFGEQPYFLRSLNRYLEMPMIDGNMESEALIDQLRTFDVIIAGVDGSIPNPGLVGELLRKLEGNHEVITCYFGSPYRLGDLGRLDRLIVGYSNSRQTQNAAAEVIFGALPAHGRLPVAVDNFWKQASGMDVKSLGRLAYVLPEQQGMDSRFLNRIDKLAEEAIRSEATPGCQILVARKGKVVYHKSFGYHTYDSLVPVSEQTIYDLASVTKVLASTQALMFLEERGLIDLDKKISVFLPELKGTNKEHMILRDILSHQAGLWVYLPFWQQTMQKNKFLPEYYRESASPEYSMQLTKNLFARPEVMDSVWQWVKDSKLRKKHPRESYEYKYSDIGYYLMFRMMENIMNQRLSDFMAQNFYEPLGMHATGFQPLNRFPVSRIAPTENDRFFRKALVVGTVHDQGAALFDGIAGHAGLFGTANDLAKNLQMLLNGGVYGGIRYFKRETVVEFTSKQYENNRRGAGWDKPLMGEWFGPTSEYSSEQTFGHTGFTGTAIWVDPEYELIYVFLANRIYPDASNSKLLSSNIRTRIQDVIYKAIHKYESVNH